MGKYAPTNEDMYVIKNCTTCGKVFYPLDNETHCSDLCEQQERWAMEDLEAMMFEDFIAGWDATESEEE